MRIPQNIILVLNKPNRERPIMEMIKQEIVTMQPLADVFLIEGTSPNFVQEVLNHKPDVILTFPMTYRGCSNSFYYFKWRFCAKIICLRAEGVVDIKSKYNLASHAGYDRYGRHLVDYELFWGKSTADVIGKILLQQGKIDSQKRIRYVGYSRLEPYLNTKYDQVSRVKTISHDMKQKLLMRPRGKNVLFASGFHLANYSKEDLFNARDLNAEEKLQDLLEYIELSKKLRSLWINKIIQSANENPDMLFVAKKHPIEKESDYEAFKGIRNILYVSTDVEIHEIMAHVGLFFHYGSTTLIDAYLSNIPSVYIHLKDNKGWYSDMGWPSTRRTKVSDIPDVVRQYRQGEIKFSMTPEIRSILKEVFNIEEGKPYHPSREIAEIIMNDEPAQRIPLTDRYLWKAFASVVFQVSVRFTGKLIKKLFRIPPEVDLLQMLNKKLRG